MEYRCTGSCKGRVTEEQYAEGMQTCQAEGCEKKGEPLKPYCEHCEMLVDEAEQHKECGC